MAYSVNSSTDSCYPGTSVLINKLGLKNQEALDAVESVAVALHSAEIESEASDIPFSFDFYCNLHKRLFGDVYEWAGELRTIDISKKGTVFYSADSLADLGKAKFARLQSMNEFQGLGRAELIDELTDFYHGMNMLHPFREGNGRTQRLFFTLLLHRLGYRINFAECDTEELMMATIYAAQGITTPLRNFFEHIIRPY